ncbi:MAG: DEAD/DEAH box helicase, partial [Aquificaceae bacterium]
MEGRAGRFGIRDVGYSNLLVYGAKEGDLKKGLDQALNKPFSTATMEEGESLDIISFFLLLAHLYEKDNPERYLESTYSFRHVSRVKIRKVESFLRDYGYLEGNSLSQKGLFCVRSGIPPTSFESFIHRKSLQLDTMACIRPLLYMKKFDSLFFFLKERERFEEDLRYIKGMLLPCGSDCWKDNTEQFLFYVEGLTVRYANLKNPPGEFSYLSTDAVHLLRVLMDINKQGFYRFSSQEILRIAHAVKYGIRPEYSGLAGIKGIGHIRANLLKEVLMESKVNPPRLGEPTAYLLELMELERLYDLLLEKVVEYRGLSTEKAREEVDKIKKVLLNNKNGYMVDDKILLAFGLFLEGPKGIGKTKRELVEIIINNYAP